MPPTVPLASYQGVIWTRIWRRRRDPGQPGVRSARATGSPQSIHIHAKLFFPAPRVLPKYNNLPPTNGEEILSISVQHALDTMDVRVNDVCASSARVYEYALDLTEALDDEANVSLVRVWR